LCSLFISLQGKEFRILALLINDSLYSCLFFTITGLHFFHLVYGLLLLSLLFWSCSFSYSVIVSLRIYYPEIRHNVCSLSTYHPLLCGSVWKVRTQDPEKLDEEVKSLVTAWRLLEKRREHRQLLPSPSPSLYQHAFERHAGRG